MTIDELVEILKASFPEGISPLQEIVLRSSWDGKTYASMAEETNYVKEYLSRTASEFWATLSDFWETPISKTNLRSVLESQQLTKEQRSAIAQFRTEKLTPQLEFPDGPVALNSKFYIERPPIEELAFTEVMKPGSIIRIKAPWKNRESAKSKRSPLLPKPYLPPSKN
ncbi:MAG: AAA-like domain-containing protein [Oscillatoria sp. PMC 1068.18]|nr:AAA-like domain-containing protein [Oscillatoria sp. PMC 1076.18]MEC4988073.1 AAA-like domain-containing protein [Oscillatoria sp. PMC 1068.18]